MQLLRRTLFGNPMLRQSARQLSRAEILSQPIQDLIANMRFTLEKRKYGVGLAAPQVGQGCAISVIGVKPTPSRPDNPIVNLTVINPEIITTYGPEVPKWEGCISFGSSGADLPYAQAMRFNKIRLRYLDVEAVVHEDNYDGLLAHVLQHEVDHLQGILFVDRVVDPKTYICVSEYRKRYRTAH